MTLRYDIQAMQQATQNLIDSHLADKAQQVGQKAADYTQRMEPEAILQAMQSLK